MKHIEYETYEILGFETEWKMRDGSFIKIKDMEDSHIQNCINMMKRNYPFDSTLAWIEIFEDVKLKRRLLKLIKIQNEIKNNTGTNE